MSKKLLVHRSPIHRIGNKRRLIRNIIENLPDTEIETFYDVFGGSGVVSLNMYKHKLCNNIVLNDIDKDVCDWYDLIKERDPNVLFEFICGILDANGLHYVDGVKDRHKSEDYRKNYYDFRDNVSGNQTPEMLLTLSLVSFSNKLERNKNGKLNQAVGKCYNRKPYLPKLINMHDMLNNITVLNTPYYNIDTITENDMVYLDPPYLGTSSNYQHGWNEKDEDKMYEYIVKLHKKGVKFILSNMIVHQGKFNTKLHNFCQENGFTVIPLDLKYTPNGENSQNSVEVIIKNY